MSSKSESIATDGEANPTQVPKLRFPEFVDTEGWESKRLGSVGELTRGLTYSSADVVSAGLLVLRSTNIQDGSLVLDKDLVFVDKPIPRALRLQAGDIVICMSNGSKTLVGKSGEYFGEHEGDITVGAFCSFFRPRLPFAKFAFHLGSYQAYIANLIAGGSINNLTNFVLEEFIFQVPRLAAEQQKIADCLSSLDELIAAQARKVDALKTHKKGLMQQLFPREGEARPRLRFPEFKKSEAWKETALGDYFDPIRNGFVGTATPYYTTTDGVRYVQGRNIKQGRIEAENLIFITRDFHRRQRKSHLKIGDILMVQSGHVGECAVVGPDFADANCHALVIFTPKRKLISEFFSHYFYSPIGQLAIFQITTGNTIKHILASELKTLKVLVPDLAEQQRIASCLSSLDALITAETQKLEALKNHKKGLMQQLFPSPDEATA